ncbi:MAG: hypothetical protein O3C40_13195 [Planctomycetota bacterium]|nr:hypothetical protein [Planctomycetota bacterium]
MLKENNSLLLPGLSVAICLLAPIAILAFTLPDGYLSLNGEGEGIFAVFLFSPYLLLGLFAWWQRHNSRRHRVALFVLTVLVVAFGVWALASEAAGFRAALAESPRGPDYMRDRYQRMELFIVPVLQWIACLLIGAALFADACWERVRGPGGRDKT